MFAQFSVGAGSIINWWSAKKTLIYLIPPKEKTTVKGWKPAVPLWCQHLHHFIKLLQMEQIYLCCKRKRSGMWWRFPWRLLKTWKLEPLCRNGLVTKPVLCCCRINAIWLHMPSSVTSWPEDPTYWTAIFCFLFGSFFKWSFRLPNKYKPFLKFIYFFAIFCMLDSFLSSVLAMW